MQSERVTFFEQYTKNKDEPSPVQKWSRGGRFPLKLMACILVICMTSVQIYLLTTRTVDHSRQFTRALHYYVLDHTGFDFYWAGSYNFNYPIQEYFTLEYFNTMLTTMWQYMSNYETNVYGVANQTALNTTQMNLTVRYVNGTIDRYPWTIEEGILYPFEIDNVTSIKQLVTTIESMEIDMIDLPMGDKKWDVRLLVDNYSMASLIVTLISDEKLSLWRQHMGNLVAGIVVILVTLLYMKQKRKDEGNMQLEPGVYVMPLKYVKYDLPYYEILLIFSLLLTGLISLWNIDLTTLLILDGLACLFCWLWLLRILPQRGIYHVSMLLGKSYILVGRLFISFMPLFIGFSILAYCVFCRYAHQFSSFKQTLLSLFYICYYNMTYEEIIVTARADPLSSIFFIVFVLLFTFCVYSSMLVSVFCSFAWDQREQEMQKDILNNLKIKCSNCDHVYKYDEKLLLKSRYSTSSLIVLPGQPLSEEKLQKLKRLYMRKMENQSKKLDIVLMEMNVEQQEMEGQELRKYRRGVINILKEKLALLERMKKP